jgi:archaellum biogenesis protein FlaJ (TadC family)
MFKEFKKKVLKMNEELDYVEYVSSELQEKFYKLEKDLEEAFEFCSENEKEEFKKLLKRLSQIKENNDII